MASEAGKDRFAVLDGMRGLAAFAVINDHVSSPTISAFIPGRHLAVDFFFVLSGFVLAHAYGERLRSGMSLLSFLRVRLTRLYPLYLVAACIGAARSIVFALQGWGGATISAVGTSAASALVMLPAPPQFSVWPNSPFPFNPPAWSLFFELVINVVYALVGRRITPAGCLLFMALGIAMLVPAALSFGDLSGGYAWSNFGVGLARVTFGFFAGVFVYQAKLHDRVRALPALGAFMALFAVFMVPAIGLGRTVFDLVAAVLICPALVVFCANSKASGGLLRVSSWVGMLSYGVYVLHVPIWGMFQLVFGYLEVELPGAANVLLVACATMAAAAILDVLYDKPLRKWLSRLTANG